MKDAEYAVFKEYSKQYWSNAVNALASSIGSTYEHYANLDIAGAKHQNAVAAKLHSSYKDFSDTARKLAVKANALGIDAKNTIKISNEHLVDALKSRASELKIDLSSAKKRARYLELNAINNGAEVD